MGNAKLCPACQEPVEPDALKCPFCQTALGKTCPQCKSIVNIKAVLCKNCRTPLGAEPPPPPMPSVASGGSWVVTDDAKLWAMFAHLGMLLLGFLAPLIIYFVKKDESKFVAHHALQALILSGALFCVSMGLIVLGLPLIFIGVGLLIWLLLLPLSIGALVLIVMYGIKAHKGEWAKYPILDKIIKVNTAPPGQPA